MTETRFTKMEARVLDLLQRNAGQIVTRTFFLENVWGYKSGVKSRTLDVHISKLRAKLAIGLNLPIRGGGHRLSVGTRTADPIVSGGRLLQWAPKIRGRGFPARIDA